MSAHSSAAGVPHAGFVMIDNEVVDSGDLSPRAMSLYVILARHVNREIGLAWPSLDRLCALARMARATVVKYLKELESKGWIQVLRGFQPHSRARAVNQYRVLNPHRAEAPAPESSRRELPPPAEHPAAPGGSSNHRPEVVHDVAQGSSNADQPVVQGVNAIHTDTKKDPKNKTEMNQRDPARSAGSALDDDARPRPANAHDAPPSKETRSQTRKNLAWEEFCHTLADVCRLDFDLNQGQIRKTASGLWKNGKGYNPIDLQAFKTWWYKEDWRGKKGETPTLKHIIELIRRATEPPDPEEEMRKRLLGMGEYADIICY